MSAVFLISADRNLIGEIVPHLVRCERDYSRNIVVFPGKRPAHTLRKILAGESGASIIPPRIFSIDNFVEFICTEMLQLHFTPLEPLDGVALLHEIYVADAHRVGGNYFTSLESFLPLGMKIFGELEELRIADVSARRVKDALSGIAIGGIGSLYTMYEAFYAKAEERNLATRSMRYRTAAEKVSTIDFNIFERVIFAGFFALTQSEKAIFKHFSALENALLVFQNGIGIGRELEELGFSAELPDHQPQKPELHFYRSADTHGQVFALSRLIDELTKQKPATIDRTAVVLPAAETLFPVVHQSLALLQEDEYNISLGYPITRTPVYGFLQALMELMTSRVEERYSVAHYIRFVLHPYTKNIRFRNRSESTRILFNTVEEYFLRERSSAFFNLEDLEKDSILFERASKRIAGIGESVELESLRRHLISIHENTVRAFEAIDSIGAFTEKMIAVLNYIGAHSTAQLHPFFHPFAEALASRLGDISSSLLADRQLHNVTEYVSFVRHYLAAGEVPFTGTPLHGLQVLGYLETRNLQFDKVFVLDANDDVLPGNKGHDVLLPTKVRESLGLPTFRDRERAAEYYFDLLLHGAREVHLFFVQEGRKEKSRFIEKLLWDKQRQENVVDPNEFIRTIRYSIQLANERPGPIAKTGKIVDILSGFSFTPTALDTYLRCQLKFYYTYVMHLQERDEVNAELDQSDIGSLVHAILAAFFARWKGAKLTKETLSSAELDRIIEERFAAKYGDKPVGASYLMKTQVKKHLIDFLTIYQLPMLDRDISLVDLELKLEVPIGRYRLSGKLDRVENRGGTIMILDYKTGGNEKYTKINFKKLSIDDRESWNDHIGSLQLPLYAMLYSRTSGTPIDQIVPAYLLLGKQEIDTQIEQTLFEGSDSVTEKFALMEEITNRLLSEITDVSQPFMPTRNLERECRDCAFKYLCGTQWVK